MIRPGAPGLRPAFVDAQTRSAALRKLVPSKETGVLREAFQMLETIVVLLVVLWALGLATSYTLGGLIHILLVVALVALAFRILQGRRL